MSATAPRRNEVNQDSLPRVRAGDREGFRQLVAPHEPMIYRAAWSLSEGQESAIELSQQAVLLAWRDIERCNSSESIRQRLAEKLIAAARGVHRKSENAGRSEYVPRHFEPWQELPEAVARTAGFRADLHRALSALPYEWREAFVLRDMLRFTVTECAEILQLGVELARQLISNARLQVRDELAITTRQQSVGGGQ
jgi:RNA polymerase sigma-70 factor, ECF subfamily